MKIAIEATGLMLSYENCIMSPRIKATLIKSEETSIIFQTDEK